VSHTVEEISHSVELVSYVKGQHKKVADLGLTLNGTNFDMTKYPDKTTNRINPNGENTNFLINVNLIFVVRCHI